MTFHFVHTIRFDEPHDRHDRHDTRDPLEERITAKIMKSLAPLLGSLLSKTNLLTLKLDNLMAFTEQEFNEVLDAINTETNEIADEISDLKDAVTNQGLGADADARIKGRLDGVLSRLKAIAGVTATSYTLADGTTISVAQRGETPAVGERVTGSDGQAYAAGTYSTSDGAILVVDQNGKVVSYTAASTGTGDNGDQTGGDTGNGGTGDQGTGGTGDGSQTGDQSGNAQQSTPGA